MIIFIIYIHLFFFYSRILFQVLSLFIVNSIFFINRVYDNTGDVEVVDGTRTVVVEKKGLPDTGTWNEYASFICSNSVRNYKIFSFH